MYEHQFYWLYFELHASINNAMLRCGAIGVPSIINCRQAGLFTFVIVAPAVFEEISEIEKSHDLDCLFKQYPYACLVKRCQLVVN